MAKRSQAWVCGSSRVGIAGSNPTGSIDASLVSTVCCQVDGPIARPEGSHRVCVCVCVCVCVSLGVVRCNNNLYTGSSNSRRFHQVLWFLCGI